MTTFTPRCWTITKGSSAALDVHDGKEVDTQGDAFFTVFTSPSACVAATLEMQRALADYEWPGNEQLRVRMGIHTAEAIKTATGLVGYEVHRAARIAAVGHGGQVLLSSATAGLVGDALTPRCHCATSVRTA